jgi:hypothetical protein
MCFVTMRAQSIFVILAAIHCSHSSVKALPNKWSNCLMKTALKNSSASEVIGYTFQDERLLQVTSTVKTLKVTLTTIKKTNAHLCLKEELASAVVAVAPECLTANEVFIAEDDINQALSRNFSTEAKDFLFACIKDEMDRNWLHTGQQLTRVKLALPTSKKRETQKDPERNRQHLQRAATDNMKLSTSFLAPTVVGLRLESGGGKNAYVNEEGVTTISANEEAVLRLFGSHLTAGMPANFWIPFLLPTRV